MVPCDQCQVKGCKCLSQTKGRQPLNVCLVCFGQKLLCQTDGVGSQKRVARVLAEEEPMEDSASDEENDGSRRGWFEKFSTLKVGPPKGAKPSMH